MSMMATQRRLIAKFGKRLIHKRVKVLIFVVCLGNDDPQGHITEPLFLVSVSIVQRCCYKGFLSLFLHARNLRC